MDAAELASQVADVAGDTVAICALCGRPISAAIFMTLDGKDGQADPVERIGVCMACLSAIETDELPYDEEVGARLQPAER
jgi:hypothetical protein